MSVFGFSDEQLAGIVEVAARPGHRRWLAMVRATGGCAQPIHLAGRSSLVDTATGELLHSYDTDDEPNRQLLVACRNRRASRCPTCAETYRADTYHLIRAGLAGGKAVPETVADHPRVFATLTAPSFGPVHHRVLDADGHVQRCNPAAGCRRRHRDSDPTLGQAVDPDRYDYNGAVIWNALAGKLWHRTTTLIVRHLAGVLGTTETGLRQQCRVSYGKVAEFQARGLVHFHIIVRLDGPDGPHSPPPAALTTDVLVDAIRHAAARALVTSPDSPATGGPRRVCWGEQLDLQPITGRSADGDEMTDEKVAGYVAKYATKAAETSGTVDRPIACYWCKGARYQRRTGRFCTACDGTGARSDVDHLAVNPHAKAMIRACWTLGGRHELEALRLRPWAHMLGFRGHFSTKSRRYSTTLGCLRQARQDWRNARVVAALGYPEHTTVQRECDQSDDSGEDTILVLGQWHYQGQGHDPGEAIFAHTIAHDIGESRRLGRQYREEELP